MSKYFYKSLIMGFYGVCGEKGFFDGFINRCVNNGIPVRRINISNGKIYFYVPADFFEIVRENAVLSGVDLSITGLFGALPFIKKQKERLFLAAGIALALLFVSLMSSRVWDISVIGNEKVFSSEILSASQELGLKKGCLKKKIDVEEFQKELIEKTDGKLIWASLNIEGMRAEIEVRETNIPEDDIIGKPCNYIADFDGVIKLRRVYSGTPAVEPGSGVRKGDLLISGVIDYETGESSFTEARGKVTAMHSVKVNEKKREKFNIRNYTESKRFYSISFFNIEINPVKFLTKNKNREITKETKTLEINDTVLPFAINKYTVAYFDSDTVDDNNILLKLTLENYLSAVREKFKNSRVLSHTEKSENGYNGNFKVIDNIGVKKPISVVKR